MHPLDVVGRSLADGAGMFVETFWALVLGFALSGAVQAFVSRRRMQAALGDHRPVTIVRAGIFGAASSSCSYAASALAKTLFARGADFTAAQAFMFASTNLVVELGVVLWLLLGWQFAAAEAFGGLVMLALLTAVLPRVVGAAEAAAARARLEPPAGAADAATQPGRWRTLAGWADAAGYFVGDLTMLRRELVVGFVVAGLADVAVPLSFWRSLFLAGHGGWSVVENAVLGPFLAVVSFVCSVGNVPLAAALWSGRIGFGGVVAFVYADLIAAPLLLIYRRFYGGRLTLKLLGVFWATMSVAGLAAELVFRALGAIPARPTHAHVGAGVWRWDATTGLDLAALAVLVALVLLSRARPRLGGGAAYARDPVCGMQVQRAHPGATARWRGLTVYFCAERCRERFVADPDRYADVVRAAPVA